MTEISDQEERGKVVNAAWKRYGTVNSLSLLAVVTGWAGARTAEARDQSPLARGAPAGRAKDVLVGLVAVTGVATAVEGVRFARSAPERRSAASATATMPRSTPRRNRRCASGASTHLGAASLVRRGRPGRRQRRAQPGELPPPAWRVAVSGARSGAGGSKRYLRSELTASLTLSDTLPTASLTLPVPLSTLPSRLSESSPVRSPPGFLEVALRLVYGSVAHGELLRSVSRGVTQECPPQTTRPWRMVFSVTTRGSTNCSR